MTPATAQALGERAGNFIRRAQARLRAAGVSDAPADDARRIAAAAWGLDASGLIARSETRPAASAQNRAAERVEARAAGAAASRVIGRRGFWSFDCPCSPQTLDPRADSETLVRAAVEWMDPQTPARVLDLGCGTGCLLAAVLLARPKATGLAVDRSAAAVQYATNLFRALGLAERADVIASDAADFEGGPFDLALANPPYLTTAEVDAASVAVRAGDPRDALDGGADGCAAHRVFAQTLARSVAPRGAAFIEIGADQAAQAADAYAAAGWTVQQCANDLAGRPRCLILARAGNEGA